jgi:hypothetical protein
LAHSARLAEKAGAGSRVDIRHDATSGRYRKAASVPSAPAYSVRLPITDPE